MANAIWRARLVMSLRWGVSIMPSTGKLRIQNPTSVDPETSGMSSVRSPRLRDMKSSCHTGLSVRCAVRYEPRRMSRRFSRISPTLAPVMTRSDRCQRSAGSSATIELRQSV